MMMLPITSSVSEIIIIVHSLRHALIVVAWVGPRAGGIHIRQMNAHVTSVMNECASIF